MAALKLALGLCLLCGALGAKEAPYAYAEARRVTLSAADGTRLSLADFGGTPPRLILVAPGFGQHAGTKTMRFLAGLLTPTARVASLDFRGTGQSQGRYHFGSEERQDLQAALAWALSRSAQVSVLGLSLGGYLTVCSLAEGPLRPQQAFVVSAPTRVEEVAWSLGFLAHPFDLMLNKHKEVAHGSVDPFFRWGALFAPKPMADLEARKLDLPVHYLVGSRDFLVFKKQTHKIYLNTPGTKSWTDWPEGGHAEHMALEDPPAFVAWLRQGLGLPKE